MRIKNKNIFYLRIFIKIALLAAGLIICLGLLRFLINSGYFRIQEIISEKDIELDYLKGKNIFTLNIKALYEDLKTRFPQYQIVRVSIQPPNRLIVESKDRLPLAYVRLLTKNLAVDSEAVLFETKQLDQELPVIVGLERKLGYLKAGNSLQLGELNLALKLIQEFARMEALKEYKIRKIDAESVWGLSFFIDNIQIKIGERISEGLNLLASVFPLLSKDPRKILYIDLRFKEPIIRYEK